MTELKPGDRVECDSHGGKETQSGKGVGRVIRKLTGRTNVGGHEAKASKEHLRYLVDSDRSGGRAAASSGSLAEARLIVMPEGHVLHRLAQDQQELVGHVVTASSPQGRFADGAGTIDGGRLELVEAYGKHLHHRYGTGAELAVHLGMQGKWFRLDAGQPPRNQVRLRLTDSCVAWDLIAPATCRLLGPGEWEAMAGTLGPDPLRTDADPDEVWRRLHTYRGAARCGGARPVGGRRRRERSAG